MKSNIHPQYYDNALVTCACGNSFTTGSTKAVIKIELCSKCHPFFTGQQKFVDTLGRVERFQQRQKEAAVKMAEIKLKKKVEKEQAEKPAYKSLKDMIMATQS